MTLTDIKRQPYATEILSWPSHIVALLKLQAVTVSFASCGGIMQLASIEKKRKEEEKSTPLGDHNGSL